MDPARSLSNPSHGRRLTALEIDRGALAGAMTCRSMRACGRPRHVSTWASSSLRKAHLGRPSVAPSPAFRSGGQTANKPDQRGGEGVLADEPGTACEKCPAAEPTLAWPWGCHFTLLYLLLLSVCVRSTARAALWLSARVRVRTCRTSQLAAPSSELAESHGTRVSTRETESSTARRGATVPCAARITRRRRVSRRRLVSRVGGLKRGVQLSCKV